MIAFVAVAPMRVVPSAMTSSSASSVRTPPAALTSMVGEVFARISRRSSWVAPPGAKPVEVLTKSAPAVSRQVTGADLLVVGQVGVLEDDLDDGAALVGDVDDGLDVGLDVRVAARLEGSDLDDHVELRRAVGERLPRFEHLRLGPMVPVRETDHGPDRHIRAGEDGLARPTSAGRTHTEATSYSAANRQPSSTNASSSSGRSSEWSIAFAMSRSVRVSISMAVTSVSSSWSVDVRPKDVTGEQEAALDQVVGLLEVAVLVLDDHVAVVAGPPQGGEQGRPLDVAETGQARDLPADAPARRCRARRGLRGRSSGPWPGRGGCAARTRG